jgi:hypothetical protein
LPDDQQADVFDVCLEFDPSNLKTVDQLSLMSAASVISASFKTDAHTRLDWLEKIVALANREVNMLIAFFNVDRDGTRTIGPEFSS